jgi:hypothetical protein
VESHCRVLAHYRGCIFRLFKITYSEMPSRNGVRDDSLACMIRKKSAHLEDGGLFCVLCRVLYSAELEEDSSL